MKMLFLSMVIWVIVPWISANPWDLDFDFSGYTMVTQLLISDCQLQNPRTQVNLAFAAKATIQCIEEPTVNTNLTHVDCADDDVMGQVLRFTLYDTDDDPAGYTDRQRIEMKVFEASPDELKGLNNTNFIYAWWFKLPSTLTTGYNFFHIFQLKPIGSGISSNPLMTLSLTLNQGLQIRYWSDQGTVEQPRVPMIPLPSILGRWFQIYVQAQYGETGGYFHLILKDQNGEELFDQRIVDDNTYWRNTLLNRPKWGLYRSVDALHQPSDWQLFQNVQIWKKDQP